MQEKVLSFFMGNFDHREPYVTDVEHFQGPADRLSPYHYYYLRGTTVNGDIGGSSPIWVSVKGKEEA